MISKLLRFIKNNYLYLLTILISIVLVIVIFIKNNVTPFGKNSLLCVDFYHQYGPMLAGMWNKVHKLSNIIYSFDLGLGLPIYRNFFNYLSSPLNIIVLLFNHKNVITSYSFLIGLKAVLSSFTMVYFLSKKFNTKKLYLIPLGLIYAFSAYYQSYYWNIMWLDGMIMLPLITLGIERIVNVGKWKYYTICLSIMLFSNYFIGYMLCIYSVLYFIIYLLYKTKFSIKNIKEYFKHIFKKSVKFGYSSILAGGIIAICLIPLFFSMKTISATGDEFPTSQYYDFTVVDFLKGHLSGVTTTTFKSDDITNPNISCGILAVGLLLCYIINLDIKFKNKIAYLLLLGFFILAFFYAPLDYIMHAFHVPNDLPYRYSFIYSFIMVLICAYSLINIRKIKFPIMAIAYVFLLVILLTISLDDWADLSKNMIYINMILLTLYFIFYTGIIYINKYLNLLYFGFIIIASIDVVVSMDHNWDITQVLSTFYDDYNSVEKALDFVKSTDNSFYRIEKTTMMTLNDGSWYDYHGVNTFSSMANEKMAILQSNLGIPGNKINSYYYTQTTPLYDLLFDVKYTIGNNNDSARYHNIYADKQNVYQFNDNVGLAYGVKEDLLSWNYNNFDPIANQNDYISKASGIEEVFYTPTLINTEDSLVTDEETVLKYSYENTLENFYFYEDNYGINFFVIGDTLYYTEDNYTEYTSQIPDLAYLKIEKYDEKHIININSSEDTIDIYVGYSNYNDDAFYIYTIDSLKWKEMVEYFNKYKLDFKNFKDNKFEGFITLDMNMIVYTSIPYDEGWHVYVDNKEINTYPLGDALLSFKVLSGTHEIKMIYKIPYLKISGLISIISAIAIIFSKQVRYYSRFIYKVYLEKLLKRIKMPKFLKNIFSKIMLLIKNLFSKFKIQKFRKKRNKIDDEVNLIMKSAKKLNLKRHNKK